MDPLELSRAKLQAKLDADPSAPQQIGIGFLVPLIEVLAQVGMTALMECMARRGNTPEKVAAKLRDPGFTERLSLFGVAFRDARNRGMSYREAYSAAGDWRDKLVAAGKDHTPAEALALCEHIKSEV